MKIRIKGNSIRFRLSQTEVLQLAETHKVAETTCFGPEQVFGYTLEAQEGISNLQASFNAGTIVMYLPLEAARTWHTDAHIGFENQVEVAPGVALHLLLEKDFTCLDTTVEDQSDNYPNPRMVGS